MLAVREILEHAYRIVTDGRHAEPLVADRLQILFQLDELNLAERSPVRGTEEDKNGPFRTHDGRERLGPAFLVLRGKGGNLLSHSRPGLDVLPV
jgi:hypothetical protein